MSVTVLKPGLQTTIQSRPRNGLRHNGIAASGAADPLSLALANRLVGNVWDAVALESTLLGPTLRFDADCTFAITGAEADARLNDNAAVYHETIFAKAGDELAIGGSEAGVRTYIAVAGGFSIDSVLGSPSTDLLAAFGGHEGRGLAGMDVLGVATKSAEQLSTPEQYRLPMSSSWALRATTSFESVQLNERSRERLFNTNWIVGRRADRMVAGLRVQVGRLHELHQRLGHAPHLVGVAARQ